mgnify:CR=1 FL=1
MKDLLKELNRLNRKILEARDDEVEVSLKLKNLKNNILSEESLKKVGEFPTQRMK